MSANTQQFEFTQIVKAEPAEVYYAFTNATALKEWLCDVATVRPKPGGRIYLAWDSGFYTSGEFTELEPGAKIAFSWRGRGEPGPSQVEVLLESAGNATSIRLLHTIFESGEQWKKTIAEIKEGWAGSLENLASVMESGEDQRIVLRPMLGIFPSDLNETIAAKLGVPANEGLRLDDVVETMGAARAGLRKDDVIISLAGFSITDYPSLSNAMQKQRAGNKIEVVYYRGPEKITVALELSRRPIPVIPGTAAELADAAKNRYDKIRQEVDEFFLGVTEAQAAYKPQPEEWSAKEVLAHLIRGERDYQSNIIDILGGQERWSDDYTENLPAAINALLAAHSALADLLNELKRCYLETTALYANLPADFAEKRKPSYWRLAYYLLQDAAHEHSHFDQMRASIAASSAGKE